MNAIRLVRWRELATRMRFWTAIVGYDPRDYSLSHRIYLIYVLIFFSLWGFSVLVLLADVGTWLLSFFGELPPDLVAVIILVVGLLFDAVLRGYKACRRSPFVFSEEDAGLICQTPVDRRQVALAWLLGDWLPACLPFVALAVVLRFSSLQLAEQGSFLWSYLPRYWMAAFRVTGIILPLHLALMAGGFTLGALRLRGERDIPAIHWIPIGFSLIIISLVFTNKGLLSISLWPVIFPLLTGFSVNHSVFGFFTAAILALVGLMALYFSSPRLNLSRAAQESGSRGAFQQVSFLGASPLAQRIKMRRRLGVQHLPSRIPGRAGAWSLVWKDGVIALRAINLGKVVAWLAIFGANVGMVVGPGWGTRFWALIIWCLLVGQRGTERLRSDLELWVTSRQLPFSGRAMMASEIAVPVLITMLITWLAIGVSSLFGFSDQAYFVLLAPPAIISIVLAATYDILRKCHSSELLAGQVAEPGAVGLILGALFAGIPVIIVYWLTNLSTSFGVNLMAVLFGSALGLGVSYLLWQLTTSVYRGIK